MVSLKLPSPNGFSASFYQSYWSIVRDEICSTVLHFLNDGMFDENINYTYIVLIPKVNNPLKASDYRPISFCNVIYKIMSKVLSIE